MARRAGRASRVRPSLQCRGGPAGRKGPARVRYDHPGGAAGPGWLVQLEGGDRLITWMPNKAWPGDEVAENVTVSVTAWATNAPPDWMVVSLVDTNGYVRYYADESAIPHGLEDDLYKTEQMAFRKIPAANACYRFGNSCFCALKSRLYLDISASIS